MSDEAAATEGLTRLVAAVEKILDDGTEGRRATVTRAEGANLEGALREALAEPDLLAEAVTSAPPLPPIGMAKYLLHRSLRATIFCSVLAPHHVIPAHDHGGWGLVGVFRGVEEEIRYMKVGPAADHGLVGLGAVDRLVHAAGDVTRIKPPLADIHQITNLSDENSIGIHLFGHDVVTEGFHGYFPAHLTVSTGRMEYDPFPPSTPPR